VLEALPRGKRRGSRLRTRVGEQQCVRNIVARLGGKVLLDRHIGPAERFQHGQMKSFSVSASVGFFSLPKADKNPSSRVRMLATSVSFKAAQVAVPRIPSIRKSRVKRLPLSNFSTL
jgi:hypothetical protein